MAATLDDVVEALVLLRADTRVGMGELRKGLTEVRAEIAELRGEMLAGDAKLREEFTGLFSGLREEFSGLREEMHDGFAALRHDLTALTGRFDNFLGTAGWAYRDTAAAVERHEGEIRDLRARVDALTPRPAT